MDKPNEQLKKYNKLLEILISYKSAAIAFSSGVDSTLLLYAAKEALSDNMIAITASSSSFPKRELKESTEFCQKYDIRHIILETDELAIEGFSDNPVNRCYICKKALFSGFLDIAKKESLNVVAEGSNVDDTGDYRPGLLAIKELDIKSPLREAGLTKNDIRILSKYFSLPTWDKPSYACLASRFVYGEKITSEKLEMVEKAEQLLIDEGFKQVRVRIHDMMARIEVMPEDFEKLISEDIRKNVVESLKKYGFNYVSMDLSGYRTGSMNEVIN